MDNEDVSKLLDSEDSLRQCQPFQRVRHLEFVVEIDAEQDSIIRVVEPHRQVVEGLADERHRREVPQRVEL